MRICVWDAHASVQYVHRLDRLVCTCRVSEEWEVGSAETAVGSGWAMSGQS